MESPMVNEHHTYEHQFEEFVDHRHWYWRGEVTCDKHHNSVDDEQSIEHRHFSAEHEIGNESDGWNAHHCNKRAIATTHEIEYGYREKEKE